MPQQRCDAVLRQQGLQLGGRIVVADDGEQRALGAQRLDVERDVGSAAQAFFLARDANHRHRRFGRNAVDAAEPVTVEHGVAHHQNPAGRYLGAARVGRRHTHGHRHRQGAACHRAYFTRP